MSTVPPERPDQPVTSTDNHIVQAEEVIVIPANILARAKRLQRELPRLEWDWCLRLAQLIDVADPALDNPLSQAVADHRAEKRRAHRRTVHRGVITGWDRR